MARRLLLTVLVMSLAIGPLTTWAQGDDDECPALVASALEAVSDACAGLERGMACYGHYRIDAEFWLATDGLTFVQPADRVPVIDLQSMTTYPLDPGNDTWGVALLHLQADVPESLPGQAVTFLLMGDATLENDVSPEAAAGHITPVEAVITTDGTNANLRSGPGSTYSVVTTAEPDDTLSLVGVNQAGDWYQITLDDGSTAWIWEGLVTVDTDAVNSLPVGQTRPPFTMQRFYFSTGLGEPACHEAADALVVQSPQGVSVGFTINGLDVILGSTVAFTTIQTAGGDTALVGALLEGHLAALDLNVTLDTPGEVFAVLLNDAGLVDEDAELIELDDGSLPATALQAACRNASGSGLIEGRTINCARAITTASPQQTTAPTADPAPPDAASLAGIGADEVCAVAADNSVNLRAGPGTNYPQLGQLAAGQTANSNGYATGDDGYRWWRLDDGSWVRSDLVQSAGACDALSMVETPEPALPPTAQSAGQSQSSNYPNYADLWWCTDVYGGELTVAAGQVIHWTIGVGVGEDASLAADVRAHTTTWLSVDGTPAAFQGYWAYYENAELYYGPTADGSGPMIYGFHGNFEIGPLAPGDYLVEGGNTTYGNSNSGTCIMHVR